MKKKKNTPDSVNPLYEDQESAPSAFKSGIFPLKQLQGKGLKILTYKQMLQRLLIVLAQVRAGNTSETLLNKKIIEKVYKNIMNLIKSQKNMYFIYGF